MSGSALMDALLDPGVNVLGGLAQGFAQAALPTRMPTPIGAVLGMGAGGAMQGAGNAQRLQRGQQELTAGGMANQLTASALPAELASNAARTKLLQDPNFLQNLYGRGAVPFGVPPAASPAGAAPPASMAVPSPGGPVSSGITSPAAGNDAGGGIGSATAAALASLPDDNTRKMVLNAAFSKGLPPEAIAPWIATLHNESGAKFDVADNKNTNGTVDAGIGQINSSNWPKFGLTDANVRDPALNLGASASIFGQNWKTTGGNVTQTHAAYHTGQPTAPDSDYTGRAATRLAQWNYPGAAPSGGGGNAVAWTPGTPVTPENAGSAADYTMAQAAELERQQGLAKWTKLPPPPGDPAALRTQASQFRALSLAAPTARSTAQAKADVEGATAPKIAGDVEAAKAANAITMDRYGNRYRGNTFLGRGSEVKEIWNPDKQQYEWGDVGAIGPDGRPLALGAAGTPGAGTPGGETGAVPAKPGPAEAGMLSLYPEQQKEAINHDRKVVNEDLDHVISNVTPAKQQLFQLRELNNNPATASGAAGQLRSEFKNWVQTFAPDFASKITGDASPSQEFNKIALMGAGKQERGDLGARGGFRAIEMYVKANPNLDMQPNANHDMANALLVSHQFHADYAQGATDYFHNAVSTAMPPLNEQGRPSGPPQTYQPVSKYDQAFNATMKPELYAAAIDALNGKPYADWSKGLSSDPKQKVQQLQIIGGILQRTDPSAKINLSAGPPVSVGNIPHVISPSDIAPPLTRGGARAP